MIEFKHGNLLEEDAEALVNAVNCVGVMGKGLALQFKRAFPENFKQYQKACEAKKVQPGQIFITATGKPSPKCIINLTTKRHWRQQSKIEDVKSGLKDLAEKVKQRSSQIDRYSRFGLRKRRISLDTSKTFNSQCFD